MYNNKKERAVRSSIQNQYTYIIMICQIKNSKQKKCDPTRRVAFFVEGGGSMLSFWTGLCWNPNCCGFGFYAGIILKVNHVITR